MPYYVLYYDAVFVDENYNAEKDPWEGGVSKQFASKPMKERFEAADDKEAVFKSKTFVDSEALKPSRVKIPDEHALIGCEPTYLYREIKCENWEGSGVTGNPARTSSA